MPRLPTGTVTFLFTDIEGSTALLQHLGDRRYAHVLARHSRLLRAALRHASGRVIDSQGDAFLVAFSRPKDAIAAAVAAQRAIAAHRWPDGVVVRVRMGLHTGEPVQTFGRYVGLDVHRAARICTAAWGGQILLSQTTSELLENTVPDGVSLQDLGEHRLKDLRRPERLFQVRHPDLPGDFPPLRSLSVLPHNLPIQLTSFIGREQEMVEIKQILTTTRLFTLTGAGGSGKTRLALHVAADLLGDYPDGVWLVELATLADPALVLQAVASALGVREEPGRPLSAALADYLRPKHLLLILDNCEHLVDACAQAAGTLLQACPALRILVTSREPLRIAGETVWRVPSLSLPDPQRPFPLEGLAQYDAVRLFIERALAAAPGFTVTTGNASSVVRVCHRLDGIPLAIELAAARTRALSVDQIASRLDDRFRLLVRGSRTALPRHQTLLAAMDWSYDLLSEQEQRLLRRLSVFAGVFILEAAEAICVGQGLDAAEVLDLLAQLVDKSLVLMEEQGSVVRYRLLETVRQYSWNRLRESGEAGDVQTRHRDWYLGLAERAEPELRGPAQGAWLARLEVEHDNLRAALEWCKAEANGAETGLRLAAALWRFWETHGHFTEGRGWLERVLARVLERTATRSKALYGAGNLAWNQGDYARARSLFEESLAVRRELGDRRGVAAALNGLGLVAWNQGDFALASSQYAESLGIFRELSDRRGIAVSLNNLGILARSQGDYGRAATLLQEALGLYRELRDRGGVASSLHNLGIVAWNQGGYASAHALYTESLAISRELGDRRGVASTLNTLGTLMRTQGDYASARTLYGESLTLFRELGKWGIADVLEGLGFLAGAQGQMERTARLFGAAEALRKEIGASLAPSERAEYDREMAAVREALGEARFNSASGEGRAMTLEQAIEYALADS